MATILTQNPASLDHKNRFFEDNKAKLQEMMVYDYQQVENPRYSDKKELAGKVTKRQFMKMHSPEVRPPPGYRNAVVSRPATTAARTSTLKKQMRKQSKQVSEVGDQDSGRPVKRDENANITGMKVQPAAQVEEKMQKTQAVVEEGATTDAHKSVRVVEVVAEQPA